MTPWDYVISELRNKSWRVSQHPPPSPPDEGNLFFFVIFKLRNKSWKVGQQPAPPPQVAMLDSQYTGQLKSIVVWSLGGSMR